MEQYKKQFIDFMMESKVLKFGEFTLKSGRKSPFFMNAGLYQTGSELTKLGEYYARAIHDTYGLDFDVLFGPAYKGIPLSVATVMAISKLYGKDVRYCANRKEAKDHGETGSLLGASLKDGDRIVIIEDVTTSGASMEETVPILRAQGDVKILGLMVSLNREEVGLGGKVSALQEIEAKWGFPAHAIVTMSEVIEYLGNPAEREEGAPVLTDDLKKALSDYYAAYGAKKA
ncbi:MAG: orotate phosphoribosyltransferase [Lachnospiraceae bacterium]